MKVLHVILGSWSIILGTRRAPGGSFWPLGGSLWPPGRSLGGSFWQPENNQEKGPEQEAYKGGTVPTLGGAFGTQNRPKSTPKNIKKSMRFSGGQKSLLERLLGRLGAILGPKGVPSGGLGRPKMSFSLGTLAKS